MDTTTSTPVVVTTPSSNQTPDASSQVIQQAQASPFFSNDAIPCGMNNQCQYGSSQACILSLDGSDLSCHDIPLAKGVGGFRLLPSGDPPFYFVDPMNNTLPSIQQEVANASSPLDKRSLSITKRSYSFAEKYLTAVQDFRPCHAFPEIENQAIFNSLFQFAMYHWTMPAAFESTTVVQRNGTDWVPPSPGTFYNPLTLLGSCGDDFFCAPTTQLCHIKQKNATLCVSSNQCMSGVCGHLNSNQSEFPVTTSPFAFGNPNYCIGGSPDGRASNLDITQGGNTSAANPFPTHSASFKAGIGAGVGVTVLILLIGGVILMARRHFAKQRKRMSTRMLAGYIIGKRYRDDDGEENKSLVRQSSEMRIAMSRSASNALTRVSSTMSTTPTLADFTTTAGSSSSPHTLLSMPSAPPPLSFHGSIREPSAPVIRSDNDNGGTGLSAHQAEYHDWSHASSSSSSPSYWDGSHLLIDVDEKALLLASEPSSSSLNRRQSLIKDPGLLLVASTSPDVDDDGVLAPSAPSLDSEVAESETDPGSETPPTVPPKENEEAPPPYTPRS